MKYSTIPSFYQDPKHPLGPGPLLPVFPRKLCNRVGITSTRGVLTAENCHGRIKAVKLAEDLPEEDQAMIRHYNEYRDRLCSIFGPASFHLDHTKPISKGGKHAPQNLQVVPGAWNMAKGNSHSYKWNAPFSD